MARYCRAQPPKPLTQPMRLTLAPVTFVINNTSRFVYQAVRFRRPPVMRPLFVHPSIFTVNPYVPPTPGSGIGVGSQMQVSPWQVSPWQRPTQRGAFGQ